MYCGQVLHWTKFTICGPLRESTLVAWGPVQVFHVSQLFCSLEMLISKHYLLHQWSKARHSMCRWIVSYCVFW